MKNLLKRVTGYLKVIGIITLCNIIVIGAICWLGNLRTWLNYSNALMYSGAIFLLIGGMSLIGNLNMRGNVKYHYTRTLVSSASIEKSAKSDIESTDRSFKFLVLMASVGAISFGLSVLVSVLAGL